MRREVYFRCLQKYHKDILGGNWPSIRWEPLSSSSTLHLINLIQNMDANSCKTLPPNSQMVILRKCDMFAILEYFWTDITLQYHTSVSANPPRYPCPDLIPGLRTFLPRMDSNGVCSQFYRFCSLIFPWKPHKTSLSAGFRQVWWHPGRVDLLPVRHEPRQIRKNGFLPRGREGDANFNHQECKGEPKNENMGI